MRTVSGPTEHVVVVGAGLAGLAAAVHLAGRGRQVTVLEREPVPGGRAGRFDRGGYRVDTGPTVLTMPEIVADTMAAVGAELHDHVDLVPLDPAYHARFADGSSIDVRTDADAMADEVARFAGGAQAAGYRRLRDWLTRLYTVEFNRFIAANMDSPLSMVNTSLAKLVALGGFRRLDAAVRRYITDERLRRVFSFQSLYAGESPHRALALYAVIAYMDTVGGVFFPRGGMRALPDALASVAEHAGVRFRYGHSVTALERRGTRVSAVHTGDGERVGCDAVVLTTETPESYRLLRRHPRRPVPLRAAPSAMVVHVGTGTRENSQAHHTVLFGQAWESTFREIISEGALMRDPSLLVTRPTATDPDLAPDGADLLYVLAPVPNLRVGSVDWERSAASYANTVLEVVESRLRAGLGEDIEFVHPVTPLDWSAQGMVAGSPFSWSHTFTQTGPFRPGNLPRGVDNAVLAGSGTVPGVGVPTALLSGRLAADRVTGAHPARRPHRTVLSGRFR